MIKTRYIGDRNNAEWQEESHMLIGISRIGKEHLPKFRVIDQPVETLTSIKVATDLRAMPPYDAASRTALRESLGAEMIITSEPRVWVRFLRPRRLSFSKQAALLFILGVMLIAAWGTGMGVLVIDALVRMLLQEERI